MDIKSNAILAAIILASVALGAIFMQRWCAKATATETERVDVWKKDSILVAEILAATGRRGSAAMLHATMGFILSLSGDADEADLLDLGGALCKDGLAGVVVTPEVGMDEGVAVN